MNGNLEKKNIGRLELAMHGFQRSGATTLGALPGVIH